jgi:hypothetical protein
MRPGPFPSSYKPQRAPSESGRGVSQAKSARLRTGWGKSARRPCRYLFARARAIPLLVCSAYVVCFVPYGTPCPYAGHRVPYRTPPPLEPFRWFGSRFEEASIPWRRGHLPVSPRISGKAIQVSPAHRRLGVGGRRSRRARSAETVYWPSHPVRRPPDREGVRRAIWHRC